MEDSGGRKSEKEFLFDLILKQSDIQEGHLAIPGIHAETHFLSVSGSSSSSSSGRNFTVHHNFLDKHGKTWDFSLSSFHGVFYALTGGWDRFVEEKALVDGDTLSFWRIPRKHGDGGDEIFFIDYEKPSLVEEKADFISDAHQVFDEMSQISVDGCGSSGGKSLASEMRGLSERGSHTSTITTCTTTQSQVSPTVSRRDVGGFDEGGKLCSFVGCSREAHNDNEVCIVHFDRTICKISGCERPAHGPSTLCTKHGGGKSCQFLGCTRLARGKSGLCIGHGGGKQGSWGGQGESIIQQTPESSTESKEDAFDSYSDTASLVCPPLGLDLHPTQNPTLPPLLFESPPLSFGHHSPLPSASLFDGLTHDDTFVFCALCPPNHEFEKDTLLQLWIAYGIFVEEPKESIASQFFEYCLSKGYLQFSKTNLVTGKAMYRFKGDRRPTPLCIPRDSYIASIEGSSNINDISPDVFHVSIRCSSLIDSTTMNGLKKFEKLRTLMFLQGHELSIKQVPRNFFSSLKLLRVLDLSRTRLIELPSSIGNMKHLCFLDLSETPVKRLPEAIDCLWNLQTLKLRCCSNLCSLPKGMKKLVNLRHLDFDVLRQLRSMPQGMGALTNIQTLSAFLVGLEEGCNLRQLKNMNNLSGSFCISRLENVLTHDEAVEACLSKKSHIKKLKMNWSDSQDEDVVGYTKVLSSLQPNTSLEELCISGYDGIELPFWICDPEYSKLVSITLFDCENCLVLPPLGRLHSLKVLNIVNFYKLKVIDHNFCGGLPSEPYVAFPTLERLTVENMFSLEEWSGIGIFSFPHLLKLTVKHCPKLHSLRTLSCLCSLESLEISHCEMLASCTGAKLPARVKTFIIEDCALISARILNDKGQDGLKVSHIPHVWIDHQEMLFDQRNPQA